MIDEIARMRYQQTVFDNMMLGLRLGDRPRILIATTPRTIPFMKRLVAMDDLRITHDSTYDNADHLSPAFLNKVRELEVLSAPIYNLTFVVDPVGPGIAP